ncbi:MAG TPA: glycosyltransferase family 1 protein [Chryseolinea sp.]
MPLYFSKLSKLLYNVKRRFFVFISLKGSHYALDTFSIAGTKFNELKSLIRNSLDPLTGDDMNDFEGVDLICFSHLRWNFVYQRPQHLMSRIAKTHRVFFIEEPVYDSDVNFEIRKESEKLWVIVPHLAEGMDEQTAKTHQRAFLSRLLVTMNIQHYAAWYYTPMALLISDHLSPSIIVYDCMDELSAFKFAPPALVHLEKQLMEKADVVFTGGYSLYEAKKSQHPNIHAFPSSIDFDHFFKARDLSDEPLDQSLIPHPRFGFYGVIDERLDLSMIIEIALRKKDWNFVLIGPIAKIEEKDLPRLENIHYLGMKSYQELPQYLAGWDVAIMPFALNESTRYISPTKTPEYLAGGKPVISTPILDVVRHYSAVVHFVTTSEEFIACAENDVVQNEEWLKNVDEILSENSWDKTWKRMNDIIEKTIKYSPNKLKIKNEETYV